MQPVRIGMLGLGQIGSGCYEILTAKRKSLAEETGLDISFSRIAVRNTRKKRAVRVAPGLLTSHALEVVRDPFVDIVVELIGGTKEARRLVKEALNRGKHVVTANKALLAEHGDEIFELAARRKKWVFFEASVGGGIPVMKALREGLVANRIESIYSIINGTSNYILTRMTEEGMNFSQALKEAQKKGYAEADPAFDIEGVDAQHKLAILVQFAFGGRVPSKSLHCEGIASIRSEDIAFAREFGYTIKLLAIAKKSRNGMVEARVQPTLLKKDDILANVNGSYNAILIRGDEVGDSLLYGRGAGSRPTASAVISDIVDIAKRGSSRFADSAFLIRAIRRDIEIQKMSSILSRYYLRFQVYDRPGVLSRICDILGKHRISISDCIQKERNEGSVVSLLILTHETHEDNLRDAVRKIDRLKFIDGTSQVLRIEEN